VNSRFFKITIYTDEEVFWLELDEEVIVNMFHQVPSTASLSIKLLVVAFPCLPFDTISNLTN
jgi:hypothetical protein